MKKTIFLILSVILILTAVSGAAEGSEKSLSAICDSAFELLFDTSNVTITGEAVFSLDGERFKTAKGIYIQDGDRSYWNLKLSAPKPDGKERENGYTVFADGSKIYVLEVYHPKVYKTGTSKPQSTILRDSVEMDLMKTLLRSVAEQAEASNGQNGIAIYENKAESTIRIELKEDVPAYINIALNVFRQYASKRYFKTDYDQISEQQMVPMSSYLTVTEAILACTKSVSLHDADISIKTDDQNRIEKISGTATIHLDTARDGKRLLDISFYADVSDRGTSYAEPFSPKTYDVKLAEGAMDIEDTEYTEVDDKTQQKLTEQAKAAWIQAGYTLNPSTYGYTYKQNGRYHTQLDDAYDGLSLNCVTNTEGKILELRNTGNLWQERTFNYEDAYPDLIQAEEAAEKVMKYLETVNPEDRKKIDRLKLQCWSEQDGELVFEFCEDPIAQDWDGFLVVVKVKPDWQLMYYSCFSNG